MKLANSPQLAVCVLGEGESQPKLLFLPYRDLEFTAVLAPQLGKAGLAQPRFPSPDGELPGEFVCGTGPSRAFAHV